ncbi:hypothetical protein XENOCAPTIV_019005 [Xenoophorus captivus]|uniref:Uncharacterized protein n=1 Tax=Xenoophorus captivus TaxID=1517983 RepID=A0ABV0QEU8_9TELE
MAQFPPLRHSSHKAKISSLSDPRCFPPKSVKEKDERKVIQGTLCKPCFMQTMGVLSIPLRRKKNNNRWMHCGFLSSSPYVTVGFKLSSRGTAQVAQSPVSRAHAGCDQLKAETV